MANSDIGYLTKEDFMRLLPDRVPVRKSQKATPKYPLYCHAPKMGPIPLNTREAQEIILENAVMFGAEGPPSVPEVIPEKPEDVETVIQPKAKESLGFSGFVKSLGEFDE